MPPRFPFLTSYDPAGFGEGTLDPLGLYAVADALATQLVPAVRERMLRIRFLTAMAVGSLVLEGVECPSQRVDASPYLVWEWLVVEALMRAKGDLGDLRGVPGSMVARRALDEPGYLDARGYLKTPRIFGFHGVYKRLALQLGLMNVHLGPGPNTDRLVDAWARDMGMAGLKGASGLLNEWRRGVERSLKEKPPRTKPRWSVAAWQQLASAFNPSGAGRREKTRLRELLLQPDGDRLGALPEIWERVIELPDGDFQEEALHDWLEQREPRFAPLVEAIRAYEAFARGLADAFELLLAEAGKQDARGYSVPEIARDAEFQRSVAEIHDRFERAHQTLAEVDGGSLALQNRFGEQFTTFAEPMDAARCALTLCAHHQQTQESKSAEGKRAWFDRLGNDRIYVRHNYRRERQPILPGRYVHQFRGHPAWRFCHDLS